MQKTCPCDGRIPKPKDVKAMFQNYKGKEVESINDRDTHLRLFRNYLICDNFLCKSNKHLEIGKGEDIFYCIKAED